MHTVTDATHNPASAEGLGLARIILFIILIYTLTKQLNLKCVLVEKKCVLLEDGEFGCNFLNRGLLSGVVVQKTRVLGLTIDIFIEYFNAYKYSTLRHLRLPTQIELTVPTHLSYLTTGLRTRGAFSARLIQHENSTPG